MVLRALVLASALVVGGGLLVLVCSERRQRSRGEPPSAPPPAAERAHEPSPDLALPGIAASGLAPRPEATAPPGRSRPSDARPTISGRVVVPSGSPGSAGALLKVEVHLGEADRNVVQRFELSVAGDGSFSFHVPLGARFAMLDIEAPLLALPQAVKALPGQRDVVLGPELLGVIAGRLLPPLGIAMPTPEYSWTDVEVVCSSARSDGAREIRSTPIPSAFAVSTVEPLRHVVAEADGTFEIPRVPTGIELFMSVKHPLGPERMDRIDPLVPGERRELVVALEAGITVAGHVLDENGRPAVGAQVSAVSALPRDHGFATPARSTQARIDGRFEIAGLTSGAWKVSARSAYAARPAEVLIDATAGDVRDLQLVVVRGGCIEGSAEWPDGAPVQSFAVSAHNDEGSRRATGAGGHFQLCGLLPGSYRVEARASGEGVVGTAQVEAVQVGERALRLVLETEAVFELRGTVVDAAGAPIEAAWVRVGRSALDPRPSSTRTLPDGSFVLRALPAGASLIEVEASGFLTTEQEAVAGTGADPLRFVLEPGGLIRGRVVDARGAPAAGAEVGTEGLVLHGIDAVVADEAGRFELAANARHIRLQAAKAGCAPSSALPLDVNPGATVVGVVLHLRESCRLEGRVLDAQGQPVAGASVSAQSGTDFHLAESDARGKFTFDELPPGKATIVAFKRDLNDEMARADVSLGPGTSCSVELRFEVPIR